MSLDITVLRLLKHRGQYDKLIRSVPERAVDARTQTVLADYGRFFRETGTDLIQSGPFTTWFKLAHPRLRDEDLGVYGHLFKQIDEDVEPGVAAGINERLIAADTAARVADLLQRWNDGAEVDLYQDLQANLDRYREAANRKVASAQVLDPIEELLAAEENDWGLHWRLPCLNEHMKPLVPGDFVVVAARPDKGKTTFCASELTHMAAQVDTLWPGEKRSILWFNNEGPGKRIVMRNFQAALNATTEDLVRLSGIASNDQHRTMVRSNYAKALGGRPGVLRVFDIHGMWNHQVEDIIAAHKPALVLFDMVDNVRFGGEAGNNGQRTDQLLEAMYQWARLIGVKHDCAALATSQLSADADGLQWPTLPMLKDSKTGKQGAADVIITIGSVNDPMLVNSRYIGTTKNKKVRTNKPASPMREVIYDGARGRYVEAP
jgi:replicative DNA helicase